MIVVADTSPLNYLILIGESNLLYRLYGCVVIPRAVLSELQASGAPSAVIDWIKDSPPWLEVSEVTVPLKEDSEELEAGESEAIALAERHGPDVLLLIDEEAGRREAQRRGIRTTGVLGLLDDAAARGLVNVSEAIERLRATNFRVPDSLVDWFLARDRRRLQGG
jgi:predicted nucleic acid-binding protein